MYYIHKDYLGSFETITDDCGQVLEKLSFDPCLSAVTLVKAEGRRRNPTDWTYDNVPTSFLFDRGFTGHEHLDNFDLINMPARRSNSGGGNGRVYDQWLGRFLSPDPFVQAPTYSQNFNRYSYAWNNPLKFTDPSGESVVGEIVVFAAFMYLMNAHANRDKETGNWAWNPLDWFGEGSETLIVAGVNTNTNFNSITGYVGFGSNNMNTSIAYNNNQGFGVGVSSLAGNNSFYYPSYNYYAPEQNGMAAINEVRKAYGNEWHIKAGGDPNQLDPSTLNQNIFGMHYPGGNNPATYPDANGVRRPDYTTAPVNLAGYPAMWHDRRYDNLGIAGAGGLFTDTRAIGADWQFVGEELAVGRISFMTGDYSTGLKAYGLGIGMGLFASPKTIFQYAQPNGLGHMQVMMWYNISNY